MKNDRIYNSSLQTSLRIWVNSIEINYHGLSIKSVYKSVSKAPEHENSLIIFIWSSPNFQKCADVDSPRSQVVPDLLPAPGPEFEEVPLGVLEEFHHLLQGVSLVDGLDADGFWSWERFFARIYDQSAALAYLVGRGYTNRDTRGEGEEEEVDLPGADARISTTGATEVLIPATGAALAVLQ